ncbi:MAG: ATPase [Lachnospiraceae bacterium]
MSSRIEQIIEEIEEYIDSCKFQPLSTSKIVVNKDQMDELLRELRMKTPDEIKRYQKIIANKDAILSDAQAKADSMLEEAQVQTTELVSEHEIMQQAYAQANEIVMAATEQAQQILDNATNDANDIRIGAMQYANDVLANAENIIGHTLDSYTTKYDGLVNSLQECYDIVKNNREELDVPNKSVRGMEAEFNGERPNDLYEGLEDDFLE